MADPNCTYAVVDLSKKKMNRELAERNSSDTEANMALYSIVNYDAETQEPPATTTTSTGVDNQNYSKLETFSKPKGLPSVNVPEPVVSTTSTAGECNNEKPGPKTNKKVAYCAVVVVLALVVLAAIALLASVGILFVELRRLESRILHQEISSNSLSQSSSSQILLLQAMLDSNIEDQLMHQKAILMQNLSSVVVKIAELKNLNQELGYNITNATITFHQNILALQGEVNRNSSSLADRLSEQEILQHVLQQNLTQISNRSQQVLTTLEQQLEQQQDTIDVLFHNITEVQVSELQKEIQDLRNYVLNELQLETCAALPMSFPSGYYWVRDSNGSTVHVYCSMDLECGNITGGWMRVAELNMTSSSNHCPNSLVERNDSGLRSCVRKENASGCSTIYYPTYNIQYTNMCGRVIGYQIGDVNAFDNTSPNIDSVYVDGVSLTHGQNPRKHIWTFGASRDATHNDCNCSTLNTFVMDHYFCDTAGTNSSGLSGQFFNNSLWDGNNCIAPHGCCTFNTPPWFTRFLPEPTTDDIEMRICRNEVCCSENVAIHFVELYVQ